MLSVITPKGTIIDNIKTVVVKQFLTFDEFKGRQRDTSSQHRVGVDFSYC